jgi:hypothetical protein
MVFANQAPHIHGTPAHLLPVYTTNQRLPARIFLTHAGRLRQHTLFARSKSRGFIHSFTPRLGLGVLFPSSLLFFLKLTTDN